MHAHAFAEAGGRVEARAAAVVDRSEFVRRRIPVSLRSWEAERWEVSVVGDVAVNGAVLLSVDVPRTIELAFVGFVLRLFEDALLAFFRLAFAEQLVQMFGASFEGLDELLVEALEVFVLC